MAGAVVGPTWRGVPLFLMEGSSEVDKRQIKWHYISLIYRGQLAWSDSQRPGVKSSWDGEDPWPGYSGIEFASHVILGKCRDDDCSFTDLVQQTEMAML